ncbi:putative late blight resistance protein homolog R1A-3 [Nicotiana tabacum]|uniref:Late blight resistance protein homolog R1A-3 n=1 Tax=Nicotiana tabacum TaxID=4097 RepID=A0AC58U204_TOBAC
MEDVNINQNAPTPRRCIQITEEESVGFEDDTEKLIHLLTRETEESDTISIVGMPGLGKTSLATMISKDSSIFSRFDIRAWCIISQTYNLRKLLINIFGQVTGVKHHVHPNDDIADMLRKCLMGKRFLIILDNIGCRGMG